ncbi:MAG: hypothetical protein ACREMM_09465, partial [Gemmatimonadales bacterium]
MKRVAFPALAAMLLVACDNTTTAPPPAPGTPSFSAVTSGLGRGTQRRTARKTSPLTTARLSSVVVSS